MATNTYVALKATTVTGSPVGSVTLSSIPQGYTDLVLVINGSASGASDVGLQFNSDTASNYSRTWLSGNGSSSFSGRASSVTFAKVSAYGNMNTSFNFNAVVNIQNYSNTTTWKTILSRSNNASLGTDAIVNLWRSTSAITSIYVYSPDSQTFSVGTTFTLYGVAAASVGAKATGGTIYQDSSYFYHVFSGNGTFTPSQSLSADVLCVAGGGGAGYYYGAGGGAGGVQWATSQSLTATGYTVTIGAGGPTRSGSSAGSGTVGVDSSFSSLVIAKGGGAGAGATATAVAGGAGGSGGGAGGGGTGSVSGGAAVAGTGGTHYGSAGGSGTSGTAGGGGAGAVGGARVLTVPANGGVGLSGATLPALNTIGAATGIGVLSSGNYYIAGGGSDSNNFGSVGGLGGGGNYQTSGLANTGGGAGGDQNAGGGGSGIIVVRYAK